MDTVNEVTLQPSTTHDAPEKTIEETCSLLAMETANEVPPQPSTAHQETHPDTSNGSVTKCKETRWLYDNNEILYRTVTYVAGLYEIFDEILVSVADKKQRDPKMDLVKVNIDVEGNCISVYNNGDVVPLEIPAEERADLPELIFGHLSTGGNYTTQFSVETSGGKKNYKQVFSHNTGKREEPEILICSRSSNNLTKVTFMPDLEKLDLLCLEDNMVALMKKRVDDLACMLGESVKIELNGEEVTVKSTAYANLYLASRPICCREPIMMETVNSEQTWEIGVTQSDGTFRQVSFVNGIATRNGGTHVDYVTNQIVKHIMNEVNKENKSAQLKPDNVKRHLWVFVNALIHNPCFASQTKDKLTTHESTFSTKCQLSQVFLNDVTKSVRNRLIWADYELSEELKKTDGTKCEIIRGIPKLEDAHDAGGPNSDKCTLILTEGNSAKSLAMAGLSVLEKSNTNFGVYPLKGKLLNVREASVKQVMENADILNIKRILGLQHGKKYDSAKELRYGQVMIMADPDHDGSHIKGLVINFIHSFWPSLLKIPAFMFDFVTPIVKASNNRTDTVRSFYTIQEYESWKKDLKKHEDWSIKYYKGLGTSTSEEVQEYFQNMDTHKKEFRWFDEVDSVAIEIAFSRKNVDQRKNWLLQLKPDTYLRKTEKLISYKDFVNKELIHFAMADLKRSIPSMVDGFKPAQRKILFCSFNRNLVEEVKVPEFSGYVSADSGYHHGEASFAGTIIGMAQNFVGSNNINLLQPIGLFGTRNEGGKDHASARYLYTKLSPITRSLFPKDDDAHLHHLNNDGISFEPSWYIPIIPMVLVNGSEGIATGGSSYVPNYNPRDIIKNIRRLLNDEPMEPMQPWYRGFKGSIEKTSSDESGVTYTTTGVIEKVDATTLLITELPIGKWTRDYKEFLEASMLGTDKKQPFIEDFRKFHDDVSVHFEVTLSKENMNMVLNEGLEKKFELTTSIGTTNMHLFDSNGELQKYNNPEEILRNFHTLRLARYDLMRQALLEYLESNLLTMQNKFRIVWGTIKNKINVNDRKIDELSEEDFTPMVKESLRAYERLYNISIESVTFKKVDELCEELDQMKRNVDELRNSTGRSLWIEDLDTLEMELDELDRKDRESEGARKATRANNWIERIII